MQICCKYFSGKNDKKKGGVAKPESFATDFFYLFQLNAIKITKKNPIYVLNIGYFSN